MGYWRLWGLLAASESRTTRCREWHRFSCSAGGPSEPPSLDSWSPVSALIRKWGVAEHRGLKVGEAESIGRWVRGDCLLARDDALRMSRWLTSSRSCRWKKPCSTIFYHIRPSMRPYHYIRIDPRNPVRSATQFGNPMDNPSRADRIGIHRIKLGDRFAMLVQLINTFVEAATWPDLGLNTFSWCPRTVIHHAPYLAPHFYSSIGSFCFGLLTLEAQDDEMAQRVDASTGT